MATDLNRGFGNEISLIFLLHRAGVSGGIDENGEQEGFLGKADTS